MNRYEIRVVSISPTPGLDSRYIGTWNMHAGSPSVALRRLLSYKKFSLLKLDSDARFSLNFDVINRGKVTLIAEVEKPWMEEYILADEPIPEGWGKRVLNARGDGWSIVT